MDDRMELAEKKNLGEELRRLKAPLGVFAALGNHEYICCEGEAAYRYLTEQNITVLRDERIKINDSFFLIGRDDLSAGRRTGGEERKDLEALMDGIDRRFPVILMDHQPHNLGEAAEHGVDLQVSGHTHNGQMWPFNYIIRAMYELAWGYKRIGDTHYYVTNGAAVWGPPVRVGNRPEIVFIRLNFK
jgi:predicted MPP superfamily phosphohydrolase